MLDRAAVVKGVAGEIRWAYYVAAGVEGWSLIPPRKDGSQAKWLLSARLVGSDAFKLAQRPLLFVTVFGKGRSVWPIEAFRMDGDRMTATLGARENY